MLLCCIDDVTPGTLLGASVIHPTRADLELLRPNVVLDATLLRRLKKMGVGQVWIHHDATADLDLAALTNLNSANMNVFHAVRDSFNSLSPRTFFSGNFQTYRNVVMNLIVEIISSRSLSGVVARMLNDDQQLFAHSANVAYLSLLVGLQLEPYVVAQRGSRDIRDARDMTNLGMGAMMHDLGKIAWPAAQQKRHSISGDTGDAQVDQAYRNHAIDGFNMLSGIGAPATMINTILHHHQRFDGGGWPDMSEVTSGRRTGKLQGHDIHIFSRIVAAANVLDNLTLDVKGRPRPLVAAIYDLAGPRFDGWFDPVVRDAIVRCISPFSVGSQVTLSDARQAVVIAPNVNHPCQPVVRPLVSEGDVVDTVDLVNHPELFITHWTGIEVSKWKYEPKPVEPSKEKAAGLAKTSS